MAQTATHGSAITGCVSCRHFLGKGLPSMTLKKGRSLELMAGGTVAAAAAPLVAILQNHLPDVAPHAWPLVFAELRVGAACLLCTSCSSALLGACRVLLDLRSAEAAGSSPFGTSFL